MCRWPSPWPDGVQSSESGSVENETEKNLQEVTPKEWARRRHQLRQQAWTLILELFDGAEQLVRQATHRHTVPLSHHVGRYIQAIAKLGPIAFGDLDDDTSGPAPLPIPLAVKEAIQRIYGPLQAQKNAATTNPTTTTTNNNNNTNPEVRHALTGNNSTVH